MTKKVKELKLIPKEKIEILNTPEEIKKVENKSWTNGLFSLFKKNKEQIEEKIENETNEGIKIEKDIEKKDYLERERVNETDEKLTNPKKGGFFWLFRKKKEEKEINEEKVINAVIEEVKTDDKIKTIENTITEKNNEIENTTIIEEVKKSSDEITTNEENKTEEKKSFFASLFWKKKEKLNTQNIKDFEWAIKWIVFFIDTEDWKKAKLWLDEIEEKEEKAYKSLISKIPLEKERKKQTAIFKKRQARIEKLKDALEEKEIKYNTKKEAEKFKIKFIQVKWKLDELIWARRNYEALDLVTNFLNDNKENTSVIKFYNKWKAVIQKNIEKQIKEEEKKAKKSAKDEAFELIWEKTNIIEDNNDEVKEKKVNNKFLLTSLFEKFNIYKKVQAKLKEKKLLDEVTMLIESQKEIDEIAKKRKLENIHVWLIKEIDNDKLLWYDFFAKILWKDKISWDTFWFAEDNNTYKFFLWDATWHWIQAWLIITLLTRLFHSYSRNNILEQLVFEVNNWLKQDLKSRNFITWIFFEVEKKNLNTLRYVWMWHEPILIYRNKTKEVEKLIAWWLAAWIRLINDPTHIKSRELNVEDWDIVMIYSDWIVESRNTENELLWVDWLAKIFKKVCEISKEERIPIMYSHIIDEVKKYKWWNTNFDDDASILIIKRNTTRDIVDRQSQFLKDLTIKEWLSRKNIRELEWKTKEEVEKELEKIKTDKQIKLILSSLEKLYITWEILKLKQEAIRFIKEWFIHKKINRYLKKAIANERKYKVDQKEQKMISKYKVLTELLKKWDYNTVIKECNEIIANDWNINI